MRPLYRAPHGPISVLRFREEAQGEAQHVRPLRRELHGREVSEIAQWDLEEQPADESQIVVRYQVYTAYSAYIDILKVTEILEQQNKKPAPHAGSKV